MNLGRFFSQIIVKEIFVYAKDSEKFEIKIEKICAEAKAIASIHS